MWQSKLVRYFVVTWFIYGLTSLFASGTFLSPIILDRIVFSILILILLLGSLKSKHILVYLSFCLGFILLNLIDEVSLVVLQSFLDIQIFVSSFIEPNFTMIQLVGAGFVFLSLIFHSILLYKEEKWKFYLGLVANLFYGIYFFFDFDNFSDWLILIPASLQIAIGLRSEFTGVKELFYLSWILITSLTIFELVAKI